MGTHRMVNNWVRYSVDKGAKLSGRDLQEILMEAVPGRVRAVGVGYVQNV